MGLRPSTSTRGLQDHQEQSERADEVMLSIGVACCTCSLLLRVPAKVARLCGVML